MNNPNAGLGKPLSERFLEDYFLGSVETYGAVEVTEAEIIGYAHEFDPQWIHTDTKRASQGPFSGLIASGWHTCSIAMRIMVDKYYNQDASLGGIGVDDLRWHSPVRAGDVLSARFTVTGNRVSESKPDRGILHTKIEVLRQDGARVLSMTAISVVRVRRV